MARLTILLLTLTLLGGCQLFELERQMQAAHAELVLVPGHLRASAANRPALVALLGAQGTLVGYRIVAPGESFYFNVAPGRYQLLAFDDGNGNFILDADEPRHWQPQAQSVPLAIQPDAATREHLMQHNPLSLAIDDLAPAPTLDLSLAVLYREHPRLRSNYLQQVSLDDPRFAPAQVSLGAWQPLTFIREIGYGFYLLAPWDARKEPIFLVHGINSSPDVWRELVDSFDPQRFQLVLFHYPSGVPLNNSAYMLSEGIRDIQLRHAPKRFHVFAHSMGGLVARRAVQLLASSDATARQCLFFTLSTPWGGHPSAATGIAHAPVVAPVWRDMAPGSPFLQALFATPLPPHIDQWQLVSYGNNSRLITQPNDGVVPLASELREVAQDEANHLYLLTDSHTSILRSSRSKELIRRALDSLREDGCQPPTGP